MNQKLIFAITYVIIVLALDLAALNVESWSFLAIRFHNGFDLLKFITWFLIPFLLSIFTFSRLEISFNRPWTKMDLSLILIIGTIGVTSMLIIPHVESLNNIYPDRGYLSFEQKLTFIQQSLWWILSWAFGWELLFRCYLLNSFHQNQVKHTLWIFPLIEGAYHFQKPTPEILGMIVFSFVLTKWALKSKNFLPPLIAHILIELILVGYLVI